MGDRAGNDASFGVVVVVVVVIGAVFAVCAGFDDGIDGLISCLGRGTGVGFGAGFNDVAAAAVAGVNGVAGSFCK